MRPAASISVAPFPTRLTSFVGRVGELRDVRVALDDHRLVTLSGPGGAGKTRLAVEAASVWPHGQRWYVDLAPVESEPAVAAALAVATGAPEEPGEDPLRATARRIGETAGLILVDNCDQVVDASARAVDTLLRTCPGLTVLATSREPLRVEGEVVFRVPPLSLAEGDDDVDGDAMLLFLDRANLPPESRMRDRAEIRQICERLDGMPLAIELAAARAGSLSVADILAGLDDRFRLLADGPRTADRRQRSLAASIHWSYRQLTEPEGVVLRRMSVFRSPFTAEAATAVVAGDGIVGSEALVLLARLVEKSFVVVDERGDVSRYRLLETIREYAGERLAADSSDAAATRDRHLGHLRELAERMEPILRRESPRQWLDRFESELPDIRAAVSWAAETHKADDALRLVGSLSRFWWVRSRADGDRTLDQALAIPGGDPRWKAQAYIAAALAVGARSDPKALELGQEAVRWADECEDLAVAARAHCQLGWIYLYMDLVRAGPHLERAVELARAAADPRTEASALNALVGTEAGHDLPAAKARAVEALTFASSHDNRVETCSAQLLVATIAFAQGRLVEVDDHAGQALTLADAVGSVASQASAQALLAQSAAMRGDGGAVDGQIEAMDAMAEASANPVLSAYVHAVEAVLRHAPERIAEARASLVRLLPAVPPFRFGMYASLMSDVLTEAALRAGDVDSARAHAAEAAELAEASDIGWARSRAELVSARVSTYVGEVQAARDGVDRVLEVASRNEDLMTTIEGLELLARLDFDQQAHEDAVRRVAAAAAVRERVGYVRHLIGGPGVDSLLAELRARLGDTSFDQTWSEGSALSLDEAVGFARRGRGSRRRPATGWDALTPAERRVVGLVGEGLTNPQVAARLFVSPDTVKGQVSAAFRKLGVASRAELAAEAARRESTP